MTDVTRFTQDDFAKISNVSRETLQDYASWHALLRRWNARINLIAPSTLDAFWGRHALDSWQICPLLPEQGRVFLDLGSGAGFPGLAVAIHLKTENTRRNPNDSARVILVESAGKKASFLKTVIRELDLPATVQSKRIEALAPIGADVVTARAFAPLPRLFTYAAPHSHSGTKYILPKGEKVDLEIENARTAWTFSLETVKSITQDGAVILCAKNLSAKE